MADPGQEAGETDVEDRLQKYDWNDEKNSPGDHLGRWDDYDEDDHDNHAGEEVEEVANHRGDRQCGARELEAFNHGSAGSDRSGATCHALTGELEEEYANHKVADEVVYAFGRPENESEDEPEREYREQRVEKHPAVAEEVFSCRAAHFGTGFGDDEMSAVPQRCKVAAQAGALADRDKPIAGDRRDRTQAEWVRGAARIRRFTHLAPTSVS